MASPPTLTSPLSGVSKRLMQRRNVLLPEPLAPSMEMTSPWRASSDIPLRTEIAPKFLRRSVTLKAAASVAHQAVPSSSGESSPGRAGARRRCGDSHHSSAAMAARNGDVEHQIDGPGAQEDLDRPIGLRIQLLGHEHRFLEGDDAGESCRLGHQDHFRRIGRQGLAERDREDDAAEQTKSRHAACARAASTCPRGTASSAPRKISLE